MKELQSKNHLTDTVWYFIGAIIPMMVLFIRSPIYTRIFSPAEYGYYSLVNITFTYLSSLSFAWITNCSWRYYLQYKNSNRIANYYQILIVLFMGSAIILLFFSVIWVFVSGNHLLRRLIVYGYIYFTTNEFITFALVPIRIEGQSRRYNTLNCIRAIISFGLLLGLTFIANIGIDAFFLAGAIINCAFLIYIFINKYFLLDFIIKQFINSDTRQFLNYGLTNAAINLCLYFLISSDRFILAIYRDIGEVGIYNQVYNIAQISFVALFNVYQAVLYPHIITKLEKSDHTEDEMISIFAYKTFFLFLPLALLMSFLAKPISYILLGPEFRYAYYLLPYIVCGILFNGMNYFETTKFKFKNRVKLLLIGAIIATIINIGLNFIFIPKYGMDAAAINTMIAYIFLWFFYYIKSDNKYLSDQRFKKKYIVLVLTSIVFVLLFYLFKVNFLLLKSYILQILIVTIPLTLLYFIITLKINPFINKKI